MKYFCQAALAEGRMIFNKEDLALLASSQSLSCDKEGPLFIQEKSEGFFKRTEGKGYLVNSEGCNISVLMTK